MRRALGAAAVAAALLAGCGSDPSPQEQVRDTLDEFGRATAAKDYQALCDRVFAPQLVGKLTQVGLPCEVAMQRSFEDVENPRLTIGKHHRRQGREERQGRGAHVRLGADAVPGHGHARARRGRRLARLLAGLTGRVSAPASGVAPAPRLG